jgi:hypothetical protein
MMMTLLRADTTGADRSDRIALAPAEDAAWSGAACLRTMRASSSIPEDQE